MSKEEVVPQTFRALVENAERKFMRVRDAPLHPYGGSGPQYVHFFHKVFKAYMRLWKYQQENRAKLTESGLHRWEIGEIASRIGQLYFNQYLRTSEARFLLEAYIFYEAIFNRKYFEGSSKDRGVRFKELRFYARFLMVSLIMNHVEMVKLLVQRFKDLVDDSRVKFKGTNFKEWKLVVQEIMRFMEADSGNAHARPLRYTPMFDSYPASLPYVARFHAKRLLKFRDALLTGYHRNEVKFAELTLDTFRMLQCLEWEPSGSFYQKHPVEPRENGVAVDHSVTSGLIDINLMADMTDPNLPPNPKKAILHRPPVTQLLAVIATVCEELPADSVMLLYLSAAGNSGHCNTSQTENYGIPRKSSLPSASANNYHEQRNDFHENHITNKGDTNQYYENYLLLGPSRNGGSNILFPGDLIPFTRRPLFLIIDSDNSHAFKVLHGAERGEPAALFLSPLSPSFKKLNGIDMTHHGSQFTFFLTAPLQAFCLLVDYNLTSDDMDTYISTESILSAAFSKWEQILCTSTDLDLVWAQLLSDPFLRRLILRFIFCRAVLTLFGLREKGDQYLPICIPELPNSVSPNSKAVQPAITQLANHLKHRAIGFFEPTDITMS
ncbi:signal transducer [Perilla frutescens var. hirtella]|uniref:Signal transducer n=1 Tax=Perilla frutescens var. hirtella TaxID=608512 RepID=A0AAD4IR34_PERFH|nr:signal transducer [Perilla frutescens var. hirtella]